MRGPEISRAFTTAAPLSLAPGFSRVFGRETITAVSTASRERLGKPLKRFPSRNASDTRLKPGANEISACRTTNRVNYADHPRP